MAIQFRVRTLSSATTSFSAEVQLFPPQNWGQPGQRAAGFPSWGLFGKSDGISGTSRGALLMGPSDLRQTFMILTGFYPANKGKRGKGYLQRVTGFPHTGEVEFEILNGEVSFEGNDQEKVCLAFDLAVKKAGSKLPAKIAELFTKEGIATLGAFIALEAVKSPTFWFRVLKTAAGTVLKWGLFLHYIFQLQNYWSMIHAATTMEEIERAADLLADILAGLARDAGLLFFTELFAMARRRKALANEGTGGAAKPIELPTGANSWRTAYRDLQKAFLEAKKVADSTRNLHEWSKVVGLKFQLQAQMRFMVGFIIETVHHMDVVRSLARPASKLNQEVKALLDKGLPDDSVAQHLINVTTKAGCPLTVEEAQKVAGMFVEANRKGKLGELRWDLHDVEAASTSKLSAAIASGMKNPIKPPENWTVQELEWAAEGFNPKANRMMTAEEYAQIIPKNMRKEVCEMYGLDQRAVFEAAAQTSAKITDHNAARHHNPTTFAELWEAGCDVAHALAQKRCYRPSAMPESKIIEIINTDEKLASKRAWVKLGYSCLKQMDRDYYVDPSKVRPQALHEYGQGDLVDVVKNVIKPVPNT